MFARAMPQARVVIIGFGVPGRFLAEMLVARGIPFTVIERNPDTVARCEQGGTRIFAGDARDVSILREAGVEGAEVVALTPPDDLATFEAIDLIRQLNPGAHIVARATFTSGGMEAMRRGVDRVVVAEQVVAHEFVRALDKRLEK